MFNKQNDRIVTFGNDVSEHGSVNNQVSSLNHDAWHRSIERGEEMVPVWFERGYMLTSAVYKKVLETRVLPWAKKITKKSDCVFQQDGALTHTAKIVRNWLDAN